MAIAVSSYVGGALAQATIAGIVAFIVLQILGVPAPLALAVIVAMLDLIPLLGATIGAFIVGIVTLFTDFPTVTIIWIVFAIAYQQFENYVIQPRIQSRAVQLDPFVIVVAAIFGGTLLGIVGALSGDPVRGGRPDRGLRVQALPEGRIRRDGRRSRGRRIAAAGGRGPGGPDRS